jgi:hypothetical protein
MINIEKFKKWLTDRGAEMLPVTNEYEALRFKAKEVGVLYKSGKTSGRYMAHTLECFRSNKKWCGKPINVGRSSSYRKEKESLIKRDGRNCFFCGDPLGDDITIEHLISLSSGGKNTLANMVLCHEECNKKVGNIPIFQKVNFAIKNRIKK